MTAAADRHLLFGLLALQNGLIDQTQLVAAFQAWTRDKARPLAGHLVARGVLDDEQRAGIEAMVALHVKKHGGDVEKSLAAVPAGESTREGLAGLRDLEIEATLGRVGSIPTSTERDGPAERTATYALGTATSDGHRFRVLRPHAHGGLGAVFVALDNELHREVALKQILDRHADDPVSRARFLLEAEVTGGLEHPGIVPVYGLGTYANGRPFYAMRFIRGDSLKEAIDRFHADAALKADAGRRSLELRKLLRRFLDVCNAIDYAHSRGVLHRDIKPRNIIVGKHGETLVVDWGLAKPTGRSEPGAGERTLVLSASGSSSETLPGSALGTPAYMSPEQARGEIDRLGPRSDVYSLGATLYCLLAGRPPFEDDDVAEVLRKVERGQFPRPTQVDPSIDAALEAVCLKAMALDSGDRYPSCRALAEDVERWMADEPVAAWREPRMRRVSRWLSRHRTGVTGAAAAVLAGVVGLSAVLAVQSAANVRLSESLRRETDANGALADANRELSRSKAAVQARYDLAVEAIKAFHTGVSEDFLLKEDRFKDLRDRLLKSASDFYGKLGALLGKETDVASRRALARSNFELAELTTKVGRPDAALAEHRAVLAAREALAAETGADAAAKVDLGRSITAVASALHLDGKADEALATYRRSESLLVGLAEADPAAKAALAECRWLMGSLLFATGKTDEAIRTLKAAQADQETLAFAPGATDEARRNLANTMSQHALLLMYHGRMEEAVAESRAVLVIRQVLADANPGMNQYFYNLAGGELMLGRALFSTDHLAEAENRIVAAISVIKKFGDENPGVTQYRRDLASGQSILGLILCERGEASRAEAAFRAALALYKTLADEPSAPASGRAPLAIARMRLGLVLLQKGETEKAEVECRSALEVIEKAAADNPSIMTIRNLVPFALYLLGDVIRSLGRPAEAKGIYERMIAVAEPPALEHPEDKDYLYKLVCAVRRRGLTLRDLGDPAGAAADARRAARLSDELPPQSIRYLFEKACSHATLAGLERRSGSGISAAEAEDAAARAMGWLHRAIAVGYRNANELRTESALDSLRSRDDFRLLMMDVSFPIDPFARDR